MTDLQTGNLWHDVEAPATGERFETLVRAGRLEIERIISSAQTEPTLYEQTQDEWVVVLKGGATLEVSGRPHALRPGDWIFLPAGCPHRVLSVQANTLWLAVHQHPDEG